MPGMPPDLQPVFERFTQGPTLVYAAIRDIGPAQINRPGSEGWSIRDVLVHLSDTELVRAVRMRIVLTEDEPTLFTFDEGTWKKRLHYLWRSPEVALSLFQQTRFGTAEMLRNCDRQAWERAGIHPDLGRQTLATLLRLGVEHIDAHVAQIAALRA
jgi:uncharacterized damage-inducible protein DinB